MTEREYRERLREYGYGSFVAKMGAEAIQDLLKQVDLEKEIAELKEELKTATGQKRVKAKKISFLINNTAGKNLTGDKSIEKLAPNMNEAWLDQEHKVFSYEPHLQELFASTTTVQMATMTRNLSGTGEM